MNIFQHFSLSRQEGEIRKILLIETVSPSPSQIIELSTLSRLLLMRSGIYEVITPNYSYKINLFSERERLLGGGLEDIAIQATVQILKTGIEFIVNGNKNEIISIARKEQTIKAKISISGKEVEGIYTGNKTYDVLRKRFLCFCPIYGIIANGDGKFESDDIMYEGKFQKNLFHDLTGDAILLFGY